MNEPTAEHRVTFSGLSDGSVEWTCRCGAGRVAAHPAAAEAEADAHALPRDEHQTKVAALMELVEWLRVKLDEIAARRRSRGSWFVVSGRTLDVCVRFVPGHYWVRLALSFTGECEPGHAWMYGGCMRRDAWRIGRVGFVVMRLPRGEVLAHRQS